MSINFKKIKMSQNNNKQTLFRFVSFRNPNLAETNSENLKFIQRDKNLTGVFDESTAIESQTKYQALREDTRKFKDRAIKTVEELEKGIFGSLLAVGKSISNQTPLSAKELALCKDKYTEYKDEEAVNSIWDNLIYQYLTQEDFYIKEALIHILKAFHIGFAQSLEPNEELKKLNGEDFVETALNATIVIPSTVLEKITTASIKKLSKKDTDLSAKDIGLLTIGLEDLEKEQIALEEKENLKQLKKEIESLKEKYWLDYEKSYKVARDLYEREQEENIEAYEDQINAINTLEESNAPKEEIKAAYELLASQKVPDFKFSYKEELNWDDIYNKLREESLKYFLENFANTQKSNEDEIDLDKATVNIIDSDTISIDENMFSFMHANYDDLVSDINSRTDTYTAISLNQSNLQQRQYMNVGGMVVPVTGSTNTQTPHLSYVFRMKRRGFLGMGYANFQIHVESTSWSVSNAVISATTNSGFHTESIGALSVVDNKINFPRFLRNKRDVQDLNIKVFFSNGREAILQLATVEANNPYTGILLLKPIDTIDEPTDGTTEPTPTTGEHFGLKRLGVAEYMKVTQSVHAYVPGEVSNIENVMASELRHKSINELTRTEETLTTSTSQEIEEVSDTTKVNRAEMQTEVAKELDKQRNFQSHANYSKDTGIFKFDAGVGFASANAQHTSNRQAVAKSKEITEKAMERVQSKISEERISKIIREVSLTNVHEYDNRGGIGEGAERPKHITGVYRWVDKKMKNQIYNYGKRTMFEFMIPEPAKLHRLAVSNAPSELTFTAPTDPRKAAAPHKMSSHTTANKQLLEYWAGIYGVTLTPYREENKQIFHEVTGYPNKITGFGPINASLDIEPDYVVNSVSINFNLRRKWSLFDGHFLCSDFKGGAIHLTDVRGNYQTTRYVNNLNLSDNVNFEYSGVNIKNLTLGLTFNCKLSDETVNAWKLENYNAIIEAYQNALDAHNEQIATIEAEQAAKAEEQKDVLGNFYRITEGNIIKHNCIAYLLQNYLSTLGQDFTDGDEMLNFKVRLGEDLDRYTAKAKFLEQAFEWNIMDYTFYPYFWADRKDWQEMYLSENTDPLFRSFLQAGMARVVVTVKPGFEEAVQYFLETGNVWMGGETPVIGDPLYMSITQEMQEPTGEPQGNYWITRIPTTLTILQAKSAGLEVTEALPIFPEAEPENCENPEQLETKSAFKLDDVQLTSPGTSETTLYSN